MSKSSGCRYGAETGKAIGVARLSRSASATSTCWTDTPSRSPNSWPEANSDRYVIRKPPILTTSREIRM